MMFAPVMAAACAVLCFSVLPAAATPLPAAEPAAATPSEAAPFFAQSRSLLLKKLKEAGVLNAETAAALEKVPVVSGGNGLEAVWESGRPAVHVAPNLLALMESGMCPGSTLSKEEQYIAALAAVLADCDWMLRFSPDKPRPKAEWAYVQTAAELSALNLFLNEPLSADAYGDKGKKLAEWLATKAGAACLKPGANGCYTVQYEALASLTQPPPSSAPAPKVKEKLPPFFERMDAATDKAELLSLLAELRGQPELRRFEVHTTKAPEVLPLDKLDAEQARQAQTWISESEIVRHVSDEFLAVYNELYYPCLQRFFRKLCSAEKVQPLSISLGAPNSMFPSRIDYTDCIVVNSALDATYNAFVKENNANFAVFMIKPTGPIDWAHIENVKEISAEVSLYAMPIAYKGIIEKSGVDIFSAKNPVTALTVVGEKGTVGGYYATPAVAPWIEVLPNAALVNPLNIVQHRIEENAYPLVEKQALPGLPLTEEEAAICGSKVTLQNTAPGQDGVSMLAQELLGQLQKAGALPAEDADYLRGHCDVVFQLIENEYTRRGNNYVYLPGAQRLVHGLDEEFNYPPLLSQTEKLVASIVYELTLRAIINRKTKDCPPDKIERESDRVRYSSMDARHAAAYMAYTALHLRGSQVKAEALLQKHDCLQRNYFAVWDETKQIARLTFKTETAAATPASKPTGSNKPSPAEYREYVETRSAGIETVPSTGGDSGAALADDMTEGDKKFLLAIAKDPLFIFIALCSVVFVCALPWALWTFLRESSRKLVLLPAPEGEAESADDAEVPQDAPISDFMLPARAWAAEVVAQRNENEGTPGLLSTKKQVDSGFAVMHEVYLHAEQMTDADRRLYNSLAQTLNESQKRYPHCSDKLLGLALLAFIGSAAAAYFLTPYFLIYTLVVCNYVLCLMCPLYKILRPDPAFVRYLRKFLAVAGGLGFLFADNLLQNKYLTVYRDHLGNLYHDVDDEMAHSSMGLGIMIFLGIILVVGLPVFMMVDGACNFIRNYITQQ